MQLSSKAIRNYLGGDPSLAPTAQAASANKAIVPVRDVFYFVLILVFSIFFQEDAIKISDFTLDTFLLFMSRLCNRQDIDKIFTEM